MPEKLWASKTAFVLTMAMLVAKTADWAWILTSETADRAEVDAGAVSKIEGGTDLGMAIATMAKTSERARMALTSTSVLETLAVEVAIATAAKTAEWAWRLTL